VVEGAELIFFHRFGVLDRELWDKDKMVKAEGCILLKLLLQLQFTNRVLSSADWEIRGAERSHVMKNPLPTR